MTERFVDDMGRIRDRQVTSDDRRPMQVARIVSLAPVVVEVLSTGRKARLYKWLRPINDVDGAPPSVGVGDLILVAAVTQGLIGIGEVVG